MKTLSLSDQQTISMISNSFLASVFYLMMKTRWTVLVIEPRPFSLPSMKKLTSTMSLLSKSIFHKGSNKILQPCSNNTPSSLAASSVYIPGIKSISNWNQAQSQLVAILTVSPRCIKLSLKRNLIALKKKVSSLGPAPANGCRPHSSFPKRTVECDGFWTSVPSTKSSNVRCTTSPGSKISFLVILVISISPRLTFPCMNLTNLAKSSAQSALLSGGQFGPERPAC
jgi:hypothetical protein